MEIHQRLKSDNHGYEGSKLIPQDWADMLQEDPKFAKEFKRVFNNYDILESDYFTPEVLEDTHVDMEITMSRYGECPKFLKVTKGLWDANGIPIGRAHNNTMFETRVYEVEYLDG